MVSSPMRKAGRRLVAVVMLAAFVLPSATPLSAGGTGAMECPGAASSAPRTAVLVTGAPACPHAGAAPCVSPVGCVAAALALRAAPAAFELPAPSITLGVLFVAPHGDLFRSGPPTPPPNSI